SYIIFDLEQQLSELQIKYGDKHPSTQQLQDTITNMNKNLSGQIIPNIEAIGPASVKIFEQAIPGLRPIGTSKKITIILAFFMSIFLGVMLVFVFDYMDQTFKSPQEVERLLNTPVLGSIPKIKRKRKVVIKDTDKKTPYTYAYQILSDQIYMLMKDRKIKSLTLTSALAQEGVSTIIANVGTYLAKKAGHKVLIVDANLRTPKIHALFNIKNDIGLGQVLEGKAQSDKIIHNLGENLFVVSAGNTELNPVTLLDSSVMTDFLQKAQEIFDIVLIDCSELKDFKDAVLLSSRTDGTAFVINEGKTRKQVIQKVIGILDKDKMLGVILNKRTFSIPKVIYDNF
ncbi:MAG: polysaccharide biosynthesis tyrosine autokinase, partial [Candidatus Omnitrophica bacterium]|nr:polysaccharide biosynthesis tyrosine autokinase [Candidatus Omnitrophota bacterium]